MAVREEIKQEKVIGNTEGERYIYSLKDLAKFLHCSPVTAQRRKNEGEIPYKQMGRKVIYDKVELTNLIREGNKKVKRGKN
jgi:hypothetical protein